MRKLIHKYGFAHTTWNFTESSHGRGPADGVGRLVKRTADGMINLGHDIPDATSLFNSLNGKLEIDVLMISEEDIWKVDSITPTAQELKMFKLPGIMKVHQVRSSSIAACIEHRVLNCFCKSASNCLDPVKCWEDLLSSTIEPLAPAMDKKRNQSNKRQTLPKKMKDSLRQTSAVPKKHKQSNKTVCVKAADDLPSCDKKKPAMPARPRLIL